MTGVLGKSARERIDAATAAAIGGANLPPGGVSLVAVGEEVHVCAVGELAIGGEPVRRDSIFRIASMTKPLAAATAMTMVRDGLIDLEEPVERLLPELSDRSVLRHAGGPLDDTLPALRSATVRELMSFTFGMGFTPEMFSGAEPWPIAQAAEKLALRIFGPPDPWLSPEPDTWIARFASLPLMAQPGERWLYNAGAQVLGVLLARAGGESLEAVMRERLTDPLGMRDTAFHTDAADRLATAYQPSPEGIQLFDTPGERWSAPPAFPDAAAGLVSSVDDMYAFARMMLTGGEPVLDRAAVAEITRDQLTEAQKARGGLGPDFFAHASWGLCVAVREDGAFGWDGGLGTSILVDPGRDLTVIVLTQLMFERAGTPASHAAVQAAAYAALED